jgi:hypothetical protein
MRWRPKRPYRLDVFVTSIWIASVLFCVVVWSAIYRVVECLFYNQTIFNC